MMSRQFRLLVQALKRESSLCASYAVHIILGLWFAWNLKCEICMENVNVEIKFWLWKVRLHLFYNSLFDNPSFSGLAVPWLILWFISTIHIRLYKFVSSKVITKIQNSRLQNVNCGSDTIIRVGNLGANWCQMEQLFYLFNNYITIDHNNKWI